MSLPSPQDSAAFVRVRSPLWQELSRKLQADGPLWKLPPTEISRAAALYRAVSTDLMRARRLGCPRDVIAYLDSLTASAHNALYAASRSDRRLRLVELMLDFPRAFRRAWPFMLTAGLLFWLPFALGWLATLNVAGFAERVMPVHMLESMADAYSTGFAAGRDADADAQMTGFYVYNNVGIAFRCFATGILYGMGSVFFLVYNGLVTGTVVGYVAQSGHGANILTFMCGHGPFELTAIVISGGAGMRMGYALLGSSGQTRVAALRSVADDLISLILGAAALLFGAALIEAWWSPSSLPSQVKWGFSLLMSLLTPGFLLFYGRLTPRSRAP
ncbi:MAG TPA: stage II sporulation protein M [Polyangiaceae bacterium]|nr:stage II sporulation protein M [Polyangiaceae bacterium]